MFYIPISDEIRALSYHFNTYGWKLNSFLNLNNYLDTRYYWNYVNALDVFNTLKTTKLEIDSEGQTTGVDIQLSSPIKQIISNAFSEGITFWHYRSSETFKGVLSYKYLNQSLRMTNFYDLPESKK